jgi:hypothetical protein
MASAHVPRWGHFYSRPKPRLEGDGVRTGCSGEQLSAGRREGDESPGFVHLEPAALDREFEARTVLSRAAAVAENVDGLPCQCPTMAAISDQQAGHGVDAALERRRKR